MGHGWDVAPHAQAIMLGVYFGLQMSAGCHATCHQGCLVCVEKNAPLNLKSVSLKI